MQSNYNWQQRRECCSKHHINNAEQISLSTLKLKPQVAKHFDGSNFVVLDDALRSLKYFREGSECFYDNYKPVKFACAALSDIQVKVEGAQASQSKEVGSYSEYSCKQNDLNDPVVDGQDCLLGR